MNSNLIEYLKSLPWNKGDVKNALMLVIMLLVACFILNIFLRINVTVTQGKTAIPIYGRVESRISGHVDADISEGIRCTIYSP